MHVLLFITVKFEKIPSVVKDTTHETHTTLFTNSRKRASGFTSGVFQGVFFEPFISSVHYFGIIIKEKGNPFIQG